MYSIRPNLIIGFHGCDKNVAKKIINGVEKMKSSENSFDWLGNGIYFWENDYERALEFAQELYPKTIKYPFVIGGIINLGNCLDLTTRKSIQVLKAAYENVVQNTVDASNLTNKQGKRGNTNGDLLLRNLDCYTIETLHKINIEKNIKPYDSIKAAFWEGEELYSTAGFKEKNHIQICIRNTDCILGYFLPKNAKL